MSKKFIYINGKKSVEVEYGADEVIVDVYIDGVKHQFKEDNPNKLEYALATKRKKYSEFLNNQFENLIILTGAGSSVNIGESIIIDDVSIERKGRLLAQLWDDVAAKLSQPFLDKFCKLVRYEEMFKANEEDVNFQYVKNLEKLLSLANIAKNYVIDVPAEGEEAMDIDKIIKEIEKIIKVNCSLKLPENAPHSLFIEKITKRKVTLPRVKIFTLNYDTLFEQAGRKKNFTIIDGFSFSHPRTFSGRNFDLDIVSRNSSRVKEEDNFVQKVFHLYKPHGSVDWAKEGYDIIQKDEVENPLMIFPKDSKYESSYEQPFFEMMSRFQQNLRNENVLLICVGFSFSDKHIVTAIVEALEQNPGFQLMVVNKDIDTTSETFKPIFEASKKHNNIVLIDELFEDFANNFPDLKSYNQEDAKKIILNLNTPNNE
ncbi:SIR2 family protein [Flavobacterium sp.]|uniref:SIR2 family protein n=1 Tax=Flavobacterium sp. TaxID=239 RepID=UPI00286E5A24|nr:SIR2 family protein [Flavobacterium sp.]